VIAILGIDGLEYEYVIEFECTHLMQKSFGKTDISLFSTPLTVVLWTSFLTGRNTEKEVPADPWSFRVSPEETFFSYFEQWKAIDVPGFTYDTEKHARERELMRKYFYGEADI